jgi:hypothetical protein
LSTISPLGAGVPPIAPATPAAGSSRTHAAAAANPPGGLWDVLTAEERDYFLSVAALGPVSYGRGSGSPAPSTAPVGQRIDVTG